MNRFYNFAEQTRRYNLLSKAEKKVFDDEERVISKTERAYYRYTPRKKLRPTHFQTRVGLKSPEIVMIDVFFYKRATPSKGHIGFILMISALTKLWYACPIKKLNDRTVYACLKKLISSYETNSGFRITGIVS
jgi:hypothetical protein